MTIRIIEAPDRGESWIHYDSSVRTVREREIIYHDGSVGHKNYHAKIEILSVMDAPKDYDEGKAFYMSLQGLSDSDYLVNPFSQYRKMTENAFDALDLPLNFC